MSDMLDQVGTFLDYTDFNSFISVLLFVDFPRYDFQTNFTEYI